MKVIITQRHSRNTYGQWVDSLENDYILFFESQGVIPILISSVTANLNLFLDSNDISGIILTGGGDIDPDRYSGETDSSLNISTVRDKMEYRLIEHAVKTKTPLLGICRGMQYINVFFGGSLLNLSKTAVEKQHAGSGPHGIKLKYEEIIRVFESDTAVVNSFHNYGLTINELSKQLTCFAQADDLPVVEGLYHDSYPIAGIQWHPERPHSDIKLDELIFSSFLNKKYFWSK